MYQSYGFQNFKLNLHFLKWRQNISICLSRCEIWFQFEKWSENLYHGLEERVHFKMFWSFQSIYWSSQKQYPSSVVYEENGACLQFAKMSNLSHRIKNIGLSYHWFRSKVYLLEIDIQAVSSTNQLADQFTKGLFQEKFLGLIWKNLDLTRYVWDRRIFSCLQSRGRVLNRGCQSSI